VPTLSAASLCACDVVSTDHREQEGRAALCFPRCRRHLEPTPGCCTVGPPLPSASIITQVLMVALDLSAPGLGPVAQLHGAAGEAGGLQLREEQGQLCRVAKGGCSCAQLGPSAAPCSSRGLLSERTHCPKTWAWGRWGGSRSLPSCQSTIDRSSRRCRDLARGWTDKRDP